MVRKHFRLLGITFVGLLAATAVLATSAFANHPVLVEGNCNGPGTAPRTAVTPGTCGDYDGDGRIGTAEDTDEGDRVFGTLTAALGTGTGAAAGTGVDQNGTVTVVSSGVFAEVVVIGVPVPGLAGGSLTPGNVTLQAAPGVEANIDAVLQGEPGTGARQNRPGIIVNMPNKNRQVSIRNITTRNWTSGIQIRAESRVALSNVRAENNVNYGIEVVDQARVAISKSEILSTGFRLNPVSGNFPVTSQPNPGIGISFEDNSSGSIWQTVVSGSFGAGIANETDSRRASSKRLMHGPSLGVCVANVNVFDNNPDFEGIRYNPRQASCPRRDGDSFANAKRRK